MCEDGEGADRGTAAYITSMRIDLTCNAEYKQRHAPIGARIMSRGENLALSDHQSLSPVRRRQTATNFRQACPPICV
jgi:hypothetical protein